MNAMGIIGIILSGAVTAVILMGGIYAIYQEWYDHKQKMLEGIIDHAAEVYSEETRELFQNIMESATEYIPRMTKTCLKSFEEDEEP